MAFHIAVVYNWEACAPIRSQTFCDYIILPFLIPLSSCSLNACHLTAGCCKILEIGIHSSEIRELDLGNNNITDDGILLLSDTLKNSKLEKLRYKPNNKYIFLNPRKSNKDVLIKQVIFCLFRLKSCNLTERSARVWASVISSDANQLKELDLSHNDLMDIGVKELSEGLGSPHCKLEILM